MQQALPLVKYESRENKPEEFSQKSNLTILSEIWIILQRSFFPDRTDLLAYKVVWSNRKQKRTLASCSLRTRKISVAKELNYEDFHQWLSPLLYHEMCHAVIGRSKTSGSRCWHGSEFKQLEVLHPKMEEFRLWTKSGGWRKAVMSERKRSWWKSFKTKFTGHEQKRIS